MGGTGKILVIKPSSLGDVVHTFPALELLRRSYPDAELDFVIHPALAELLDLSPFPVRKKIYFNRRELGSLLKGPVELCKLISEIRREEYELVVDFQGLFRSGFLSGAARSCITAGFACPREKSAAWFYNRKIDVHMEQHAVSRYAELVNKLCGTSFTVPEVELPIQTRGLPQLPEHFMVIVPCARWESKTFPPELFAAIAAEARKTVPQCGIVIEQAGFSGHHALLHAAVAGVVIGEVGLPPLAQAALRDDAAFVGDMPPEKAELRQGGGGEQQLAAVPGRDGLDDLAHGGTSGKSLENKQKNDQQC